MGEVNIISKADPVNTILRPLLERLNDTAERHDELGEYLVALTMSAAAFSLHRRKPLRNGNKMT
jgi:hypothetical protein